MDSTALQVRDSIVWLCLIAYCILGVNEASAQFVWGSVDVLQKRLAAAKFTGNPVALTPSTDSRSEFISHTTDNHHASNRMGASIKFVSDVLDNECDASTMYHASENALLLAIPQLVSTQVFVDLPQSGCGLLFRVRRMLADGSGGTLRKLALTFIEPNVLLFILSMVGCVRSFLSHTVTGHTSVNVENDSLSCSVCGADRSCCTVFGGIDIPRNFDWHSFPFTIPSVYLDSHAVSIYHDVLLSDGDIGGKNHPRSTIHPLFRASVLVTLFCPFSFQTQTLGITSLYHFLESVYSDLKPGKPSLVVARAAGLHNSAWTELEFDLERLQVSDRLAFYICSFLANFFSRHSRGSLVLSSANVVDILKWTRHLGPLLRNFYSHSAASVSQSLGEAQVIHFLGALAEIPVPAFKDIMSLIFLLYRIAAAAPPSLMLECSAALCQIFESMDDIFWSLVVSTSIYAAPSWLMMRLVRSLMHFVFRTGPVSNTKRPLGPTWQTLQRDSSFASSDNIINCRISIVIPLVSELISCEAHRLELLLAALSDNRAGETGLPTKICFSSASEVAESLGNVLTILGVSVRNFCDHLAPLPVDMAVQFAASLNDRLLTPLSFLDTLIAEMQKPNFDCISRFAPLWPMHVMALKDHISILKRSLHDFL